MSVPPLGGVRQARPSTCALISAASPVSLRSPRRTSPTPWPASPGASGAARLRVTAVRLVAASRRSSLRSGGGDRTRRRTRQSKARELPRLDERPTRGPWPRCRRAPRPEGNGRAARANQARAGSSELRRPSSRPGLHVRSRISTPAVRCLRRRSRTSPSTSGRATRTTSAPSRTPPLARTGATCSTSGRGIAAPQWAPTASRPSPARETPTKRLFRHYRWSPRACPALRGRCALHHRRPRKTGSTYPRPP
jgi:hypothetical protein